MSTVSGLITNVPHAKVKEFHDPSPKLVKRHIVIDESKVQLLKYHQDLKDADPSIDWEDDDHLWNIEAITGHKGGRKVKVKVLWSDMTTTWEDMHAVFLHSPKLIVE